MSLPSMNDASESKKKLQWARCRPRSRSDEAPVASRKSRVASQRCPLSCPSSASVVFSPTEGTRTVGSMGYLQRSSMRTQARELAAAARLRRVVEDVGPDTLDLVGHRGLEREGVAGHDPGVGPEHELVVRVRVPLVEGARGRRRGRGRRRRRSARRPPRPRPRWVRSRAGRRRRTRSWLRATRATMPSPRPTVANFTSTEPSAQKAGLGGHGGGRVEAADRAPGHGAARPVPRRRRRRRRPRDRGRRRRGPRARGPESRRAIPRSSCAVSARSNVMLPSEFTKRPV